jgi:hypothetical protein
MVEVSFDEKVGFGLTGLAWNRGSWFCLTGMAWNGESQFCLYCTGSSGSHF